MIEKHDLGGLETEESRDLIASDKVEGTAVYGADGGEIGHIHNFMVDKRSGQVAHVIVSNAGIFGMATKYLALPWSAFRYDEAEGGYVCAITHEAFEKQGGPSAENVEMSIW